MRKIVLQVIIGLLAGTALYAQSSFQQSSGLEMSGFRQEGVASWYGAEFEGRPTASGEIFNPNEFTAAHPELPFGTMLIVTNLANGQRVSVRVNDRGPFVRSRIIDVSRAAAERLDMLNSGTAQVAIEVLPRGAETNVAGAAGGITSNQQRQPAAQQAVPQQAVRQAPPQQQPVQQAVPQQAVRQTPPQQQPAQQAVPQQAVRQAPPQQQPAQQAVPQQAAPQQMYTDASSLQNYNEPNMNDMRPVQAAPRQPAQPVAPANPTPPAQPRTAAAPAPAAQPVAPAVTQPAASTQTTAAGQPAAPASPNSLQIRNAAPSYGYAVQDPSVQRPASTPPMPMAKPESVAQPQQQRQSPAQTAPAPSSGAASSGAGSVRTQAPITVPQATGAQAIPAYRPPVPAPATQPDLPVPASTTARQPTAAPSNTPLQPVPATPRPPTPQGVAAMPQLPPSTRSPSQNDVLNHPTYAKAEINGNIIPGRVYRIQVGSFKVAKNAVDVFDRLTAAGLNPQWEPYEDYYRVVITNIRAENIPQVAVTLGKAGFSAADAREETQR